MQTNLFNQGQAKFESSIGEFYRGTDYSSSEKLYLDYPCVTDLIKQCQEFLREDKELVFKSKKIFGEEDISSDNFLVSQPMQNHDPHNGLMLTHFGSLLNQNIAGQKVLGNFSLAFIEAQASKTYYQSFYGKTHKIDHFYPAQGVCNIALISEVIKAHEIKKADLAIILVPENSIKAFRNNRYSAWTNVTKEESDYQTVNELDKSGETISSIKLYSQKANNLNSPIYKVKLDDSWALVVPWHTGFEEINQEVKLYFSKTNIENSQNNQNLNTAKKRKVNIECSLGQAARVVFELLGGDYDLVPEALLNFEGGSWSSITLENCSSGRHQGVNSMHEVLKNSWHKYADTAIPWFYLGFDRVNDSNKHLIQDPNVFLLQLEHPERNDLYFLEAPQSWKKISQELVKYVSKFIYREYAANGSKKFFLSTKELMETAAKYIALWTLHKPKSNSKDFQAAVQKLELHPELQELLELVVFTHLLCSSRADFYSCKTSPESLHRLHYLAKIQRKLNQINPNCSQAFNQKIQSLLQKDFKSEHTTLLELYRAEFAKA